MSRKFQRTGAPPGGTSRPWPVFIASSVRPGGGKVTGNTPRPSGQDRSAESCLENSRCSGRSRSWRPAVEAGAGAGGGAGGGGGGGGGTPPTAAFTAAATAASGEAVVFDASGSSASDGSALAYAWDFGEGR